MCAKRKSIKIQKSPHSAQRKEMNLIRAQAKIQHGHYGCLKGRKKVFSSSALCGACIVVTPKTHQEEILNENRSLLEPHQQHHEKKQGAISWKIALMVAEIQPNKSLKWREVAAQYAMSSTADQLRYGPIVASKKMERDILLNYIRCHRRIEPFSRYVDFQLV
jgi:hypothetical protein